MNTETNQIRADAPVLAVPCPDYSPEHCAAAIAKLAEQSPVLQGVRAGQRVLIKANLVTGLKPERAATTHPALLAALTAYLRERGAEVVIGDGPGGTFTKAYLDGVYAISGMKTAAAAGAKLNDDFSVLHATDPDAAVLHDFDYTGWLDGGDLIINFCKLKSHGMMGLSCAVKNLFGAIPGLTKPAYHYRFPSYSDFADMLIDLNEHFRPALNLVDAVVCMEGNGPTAGTPRPMGLLLGGESPYAVDLVAASLIGLGPEQITTLARARDRGLAPATAAEVPVLGDLTPFYAPDFNTASADAGMEEFLFGQGFLARAGNRAAKDILAVKPRLHAEKCVGCKHCADICPASAITMKNKRPSIDRSACIRCFCCQEFCPKGALKAERSRLGELILRITQRGAK